MTIQQFCGKQVRLAYMDLEADSAQWAKWRMDSELQRLADWGPANVYSQREMKRWIEEDSEKRYPFSIRTLENDQIIGFITLTGFNWTAREAWLGIVIGERGFWGHGYGSDAIQTLLRFAFEELNLNRVSLDVFEYNQRAIRCYEKLGFQHEGRRRQEIFIDDRRWDDLYMGILRVEWEDLQKKGK